MALHQWAGLPIALLGLVIAPGRPASSDSGRGDEPVFQVPSISVTGTGRIAARPDLAEINIGVVSQAPTAQASMAANNDAMNRLMAALKERGVADKDIQTTQVQVSPEYSRPSGSPHQQEEFIPRITGYRVDNTVRIVARRIEQLGALLDATVKAGANQIHGIAFRVENDEKLRDEATKRAMADARHKAELLAGEAGVVVGIPLKIEETTGGVAWEPRPVAFGKSKAAAPMPVSPGEQELAVTVSIIYALHQPLKP